MEALRIQTLLSWRNNWPYWLLIFLIILLFIIFRKPKSEFNKEKVKAYQKDIRETQIKIDSLNHILEARDAEIKLFKAIDEKYTDTLIIIIQRNDKLEDSIMYLPLLNKLELLYSGLNQGSKWH